MTESSVTESPVTQSLFLKPLDEADLDWVQSVERTAYAWPWSRRGFELALDQGLNYLIARAREGDWQPVGYAFCRPVVDEVEVLNFCIAPAFQRQGLGRVAFGQLLETFSAQGWQRVLLEVRVSNPAKILYQSLGFQVDGHRPNYYPTQSGREDACLMSYSLK
ncbi:ribosomal protein S18-alanine N-acetyltransferase [Hydrogenovibrio halophilus]|uniref:ribosomal protein S18-alanine N-acetyltransferase n=1 Tax=Hydrogenovibrio halophilus TaxID=373391 RepID=UPI00035F7095|nr:ribosomal protein S18-alanine N-acetyltransferase [Hydrogenovibrio halophilus]